jgi:nucleoside-diphosphate-sugar epimerase
MAKKVLITAWADFVGSLVADELLKAAYAVRVLDNLSGATANTRVDISKSYPIGWI